MAAAMENKTEARSRKRCISYKEHEIWAADFFGKTLRKVVDIRSDL